MEALETAVGYWEDALNSYVPKNKSLMRNNFLTTAEETKFIHMLKNILDEAYQLQVIIGSFYKFLQCLKAKNLQIALAK